MKPFLRETWELGYWALFQPALLQDRMNVCAPARDEEGKPRDTLPADILKFKTQDWSSANRFVVQFALLVALCTAPLLLMTIGRSGARDWPLVVATLIGGLAVGTLRLALGLMVPLLASMAYLENQGRISHWFDGVAGKYAPLPRLVLEIAAGLAVLVAIGLVGDAMSRRGWKRTARVVLSLAPTAGLAAPLTLRLGVSEGFPLSLMGLFGVLMLLESKEDQSFSIENSEVVAAFAGLWGALLPFDALVEGRGDLVSIVFFVLLVSAGWAAGNVLLAWLGPVMNRSAALALSLGAAAGLVIGLSVSVMVMVLTSIFEGSRPLVMSASIIVGYGLSPSLSFRVLLLMPIMVSCLRGWLGAAVFGVMLAGYWRLPSYAATAAVSASRAARLRRAHPVQLLRWLRTMPPHGSEILMLPLPGHGRILAAAARADLGTTIGTLARMRRSRFSAYASTVQAAWSEVRCAFEALSGREQHNIVAVQLQAVCAAPDLAVLASPDHPILPLLLSEPGTAERPDADAPPANVTPDSAPDLLVSRLMSLARQVGEALGQEHVIQRERGLERCTVDLQRCDGDLETLGLDDPLVSLWRGVIERWRTVLSSAIDNQQRLGAAIEVVQPFQSGNPLRPDRSYLFKGRRQLAEDVRRHMLDSSRPTLVLHGPRRCGKSSFLLNLSHLLPESVLPVYVDLQSQAMTSSDGDFCFGVVRAIARDLKPKGVNLPSADRAAFRASPFTELEDWLDRVLPESGSRRVLVCFDEFEKLGEAFRRGTITVAVFEELRHLIQHRQELSFIFCGAQVLEELGPNWSSYFINTRPIEIVYLEPEEARELLEDPDPSFDLKYDPTIVDQVLAVTRCQPYLLQLIGEAMVKEALRNQTKQITQPLLDAALEAALAAGEIYFANLWDETTGKTPEEIAAGRAILRAIAAGQELPPRNDASGRALARLIRYHVITGGSRHEIEVPLVARWVGKRITAADAEAAPGVV